MKLLLFIMIISSILSLVIVLPTYAQICYGCDESKSSVNNAQQNQVMPTDKGSLMVGFYTDPQNPTPSDQTTLELSFEDKDTQYPLPNVDYKVSISKGNIFTYETPVSHSTQGTAKVQYQFKEPGQYQVTVYVTGMNSKQIQQETVSFPLIVGSSTVPEFPFAEIVLTISIVSTIILYQFKSKIKI